MVQVWLSHSAQLFSQRSSQQDATVAGWQWTMLAVLVACGAAIRFTGLGAIGLHGDEETMAMAVHSIVENGTPHLPSGMFYPRALGQLYLMAGSVMLFGETEWALRLPSALCGIALIPLAFLLGRRFLQPTFALLFAALAAFLPEFIEYSQTARMYIFMITSLVVFMLCIHAWERSRSPPALLAAIVMLLVGVHFHALCILAAGLFVFPGIRHGSLRLLLQGLVAAAISAWGFLLINGWVEGRYPELPDRDTAVDTLRLGRRSLITFVDDLPLLPLLAGTLVAVAVVWWTLREVPNSARKWFAAAALLGALAAQALVSYHVVGILLLTGLVLAWPLWYPPDSSRMPGKALAATGILLVFCAVLAAVHVLALLNAGVQSITRIVGALSGLPSVWPYARLAGFSWAAAAIVGLGAAGALWRLARRRPIADYWLFFVLAVLLPLFALGVARWNIPPRYVVGSTVPLLLVAMAVVQDALRAWNAAAVPHAGARLAGQYAVALALTAVAIGPLKFADTVNSGYAHHPDHKGAADFLRALKPGPNDLVLAEDVLQQRWYLGRVDYWLIGPDVARLFSEEVGDERRDIYTHTRILDSAAELQELMSDGSRNVYIIGSGENQTDGRRGMRGDDLHALLAGDNLETLYEGRDGRTRVWRVRPGLLAGNAAQSGAVR